MHGMLKSMVAGDTRKRLDIERIRAIKAEAGIFISPGDADWMMLSQSSQMRSFPIYSSRR
jgi:hypothetical protein